MDKKLTFEMQILETMSADYRASLLRAVGITESDAKVLAGKCPLRIQTGPEVDVAAYAELLGPQVPSDVAGYRMNESLAASSTAHCFLLGLWPHLFWVVHDHSESGPWEIGFQSQTQISGLHEFDPIVIRVGVWTRRSIEALADDCEFLDGWEEKQTLQFRFGGRRFEGGFTWNLLDEWRAL